jgi:DNA polymerase-3 subunit delta'
MMSPLEHLSGRLCPWLGPSLEQFEVARRAGNLGHAWLISGPAGMGKLNLALVLSRRLFGSAEVPQALDAATALDAYAGRHVPMDRHPDLHWLYPEEDKETISVDQVRDLIEIFMLTANRGGAKVAIVEPAEALTTAAANALLKTLEEPPQGSYLFLLSHQPGRLPATIRSRCQHLLLRAPTPASIAPWLGAAEEVVARAQRWVGGAPLALAAALRDDDVSFFNKLESDLAALSEDRLEPQTLAQAWTKGDTERALSWLEHRLHTELRSRFAGSNGPTEVTVPGEATLHNALRNLPARALFEQYEKAEKLLNQLGSGLNIELALQAMFNALVATRGRS